MSNLELEEVFNSFCAFGAGKGGAAEMDNAKFNKLCKDLKLYDKKLTSTDTDIIFSRPEVKAKTERKIKFAQFRVALKLCAEKKYPGDADGQAKLEAKICEGKGPASSGTKAQQGGATGRLTDTSKYTGSHKERFDESGKGKGIEGRADRDENTGYVGNYKGKDTYDKK